MASKKGDLEHDSSSNTARGGAVLRQGIERVERINEEIAALQDDRKEFFAELKGQGYNVKIVRKLIARRKMEKAKRDEEDALLHLYSKATGTPSPADAASDE